MAKILVIDDDRSCKYLLDKILTGNGHEEALTENGENGIKMYDRQPAELAIFDPDDLLARAVDMLAN